MGCLFRRGGCRLPGGRKIKLISGKSRREAQEKYPVAAKPSLYRVKNAGRHRRSTGWRQNQAYTG
jgi:hypothetical protein